ncbi:MAG: type II secretion system F family protein [Propionibacteriaceae bacterium]|nr:type II secretion system F family protein [Propionibacteriaceae bacterium]
MTGLAVLAAAVACWLWLTPAPGLARLTLRARRSRRTPERYLAWLPSMSFGVAAGWIAGWSVGLAGGAAAATVTWVLRRSRRRRAVARERAEVVRACQLVGGMLGLGQVPAEALRTAAARAPVLAEAAAVQSLGGKADAVLRRAATEPGREGLGQLASAWQVAEQTGASMATTLAAVADRLAADLALRATVEAELSAPRATGRLLAGLPIAGVGLGYLLGGDPIAFLTSSVFGQFCLVIGAALGCAGLVWTELLADRHGG